MFTPAKLLRYFRREYPQRSIATVIGLTIGAGIGTVVTFGAAAPLFVIPLAAAGGVGFSNLVTLGLTDWNRTSENSINLNGHKIIGDKRDLSSLAMTQKLIDTKTAKLKHLPELPAKVQRQLLKHISDVQEVFSRVRVYQAYYGGDPQKEFRFTRSYYDSQGRDQQQDVAVIRFEPPAAAQPGTAKIIGAQPKAVAVAPVPQPKPQPDFAAEFGTLAKKVDTVAKRVDELEKPAPDVVLDKPKLSAPKT